MKRTTDQERENDRMCRIEAGYAASMASHYRKLDDQRRKVMAGVAMLVSPRKLASINQFIDYDGDTVYDFELTEKHAGQRQDEPGTAFRYIYIDQRCGGCPAGDDYNGEIWIPLPKGKYLKYSYS